MELQQELYRLLERLQESGEIKTVDRGSIGLVELHPDGSSRRFLRVTSPSLPGMLAVAPARGQELEVSESEATWNIGRHLAKKGLPVPRLIGRDRGKGIVLFEDLGDVKLYDCMTGEGEHGCGGQEKRAFYRSAVEALVTLQIEGSDGFDSTWCWDTPRYDQKLMVERESLYFYNSFWRDMLGMQEEEEIKEEFLDIARQADSGRDFFLHRDYQSRNLMVTDGKIRVIDFQGGRLGPLGYDLASLLIDPYVALSAEFQEEMVQHYTNTLIGAYGLDVSDFQYTYPYLSLQRNLQIIGAFSFLSLKKGKRFFAQFLSPSLNMLQERLNHAQFSSYTRLRSCVDRACRNDIIRNMGKGKDTW